MKGSVGILKRSVGILKGSVGILKGSVGILKGSVGILIHWYYEHWYFERWYFEPLPGRLAGLLQFFKEFEDSVEFRFHFQSRYLNYEIQQELPKQILSLQLYEQ